MINILSTKDVSNSQGIKVLVYGKAGYGKTYLARTAPTPVLISAESGALSLRDLHFPMIEIKTVEQLLEVNAWVYNSKEAKQFQTIYIDSISEIAEVVLANAKATTKDPRKAYGDLIDKMKQVVKSFRDLSGKNVVMTAKQEMNKDDTTGISSYGPGMPGGKLSQDMPYLFDEVFRLGVGKTPQGVDYRFLQTQPDLQYDAKDRSGVLSAIEPPDLGYIFNKILNGA